MLVCGIILALSACTSPGPETVESAGTPTSASASPTETPSPGEPTPTPTGTPTPTPAPEWSPSLIPPPSPGQDKDSVPGLDLLLTAPPAPVSVTPEATRTWGDNAVARAWNQLAVFTTVAGYGGVLDADLPTALAVLAPELSPQASARLTADFPGYRRFSATVRDRYPGPIPAADRDSADFQAWLNLGGLIASPGWKDLEAVSDIILSQPTITTWQDGTDGGLVIRFTAQATALIGTPTSKPQPWRVARDTTVYLIPNPDEATRKNIPWLIHDWVATYEPGKYPWTDGHARTL